MTGGGRSGDVSYEWNSFIYQSWYGKCIPGSSITAFSRKHDAVMVSLPKDGVFCCDLAETGRKLKRHGVLRRPNGAFPVHGL